jgi:hypothetical protein
MDIFPNYILRLPRILYITDRFTMTASQFQMDRVPGGTHLGIHILGCHQA